MEMKDDELEVVTGGIRRRQSAAAPLIMQMACACGTINSVDVTKDGFTCKGCGKFTPIYG